MSDAATNSPPPPEVRPESIREIASGVFIIPDHRVPLVPNIGIVLGKVAPDWGVAMKPLGEAFVKLIKMLIGPIVFTTVVVGIAGMGDLKKVGRIGAKAVLYFEVMTTVALITGVGIVHLVRPGAGLHADPTKLDTKALEQTLSVKHPHGFVPEGMNGRPRNGNFPGLGQRAQGHKRPGRARRSEECRGNYGRLPEQWPDIPMMTWKASGRYVEGRVCSVQDQGRPLRQWLEISGTEGTVTVPEMWLPSPRAAFLVRRDGKPVEEIVIEGEDQIQHMLEDFGRAVLDGQPVTPSPEEAVRTLRVLDALGRSAKEGKAVTISRHE